MQQGDRSHIIIIRAHITVKDHGLYFFPALCKSKMRKKNQNDEMGNFVSHSFNIKWALNKLTLLNT
jgi:hypothetical protein